jgi:5-methyltetrahydropteroyltriglutamate--homocysteine methyltransferase
MRITRALVGGFPRLDSEIDRAIDASIKLQLRHGIDILSDGDQRGDMISYYSKDIPGLGTEGSFSIVSGKVRPPSDVMEVQKVKDFLMLKKKHPNMKFKVSVVGPTTMALVCGSRKIVRGYKNYVDFSLASDIAAALKEIVSPLAEMKALIQIDEPFFSQGLRDLRERIRLIDGILEGCDRSLCSVHVCGFLGRQPLLEELARLENVGTLSHAFSIDRDKEKDNLTLLRREIFEDSDKKLAAGIISVSARVTKDVERPQTVARRLRTIVDRIGLDNLAYVTPDCYLRALDKELVDDVLTGFTKGTDIFEKNEQ